MDVRRGDTGHLCLMSGVGPDPSPSDGLLEGPVEDHVRSFDRRRCQGFAVLAAPLSQLPVEPVDVLRSEPRYRIGPKPRVEVQAYGAGGLQDRARREVGRGVLEPPLEELADRTARRGNTAVIGGGNKGGERSLRLPLPALHGL